MSNEDAAKFGVTDKQIVKVKTSGPRALVFENVLVLSLIHISEPTRQAEISYAVFCLKKKKNQPSITA
ncbi:Propanediol utilization protein PduL [Clostridioides difficile]|nr:Propanediol utilization protein PduL [Clostridioides difficile]